MVRLCKMLCCAKNCNEAAAAAAAEGVEKKLRSTYRPIGFRPLEKYANIDWKVGFLVLGTSTSAKNL